MTDSDLSFYSYIEYARRNTPLGPLDTPEKAQLALHQRADCLAKHHAFLESLREKGTRIPAYIELANKMQEDETDEEFLSRMESLGYIPAAPTESQ